MDTGRAKRRKGLAGGRSAVCGTATDVHALTQSSHLNAWSHQPGSTCVAEHASYAGQESAIDY
eukprot:615067-Alexandrium_andersonii.AAC.1